MLIAFIGQSQDYENKGENLLAERRVDSVRVFEDLTPQDNSVPEPERGVDGHMV